MPGRRDDDVNVCARVTPRAARHDDNRYYILLII